jgi:hypothetical protein
MRRWLLKISRLTIGLYYGELMGKSNGSIFQKVCGGKSMKSFTSFSKSFYVCIILLCVVTGISHAQSLTYYIDSNDGDDAGSGLATGYAWKTFTNVNSKTFQAGDHILLKSGSVFTGQFKPKGSGALGNPIVIDMYGGTVKPIINGNGVTGQGTIYLVNQQYIEINNLEITNSASSSGDRRGVNIANSNGGVIHHIYLKNLDIHDVTGIVGDDDKSKRTAGIGIETIADDNVKESRYDSVLIDGCHIHNLQNTGIYTDNTVKRNDYPRTTGWTNRRFTNLMILTSPSL